ncbi:MAG: carboxypeptidase-like regulatory domain-containing protein, partial [Candidatus Acidiferrales bacterium]
SIVRGSLAAIQAGGAATPLPVSVNAGISGRIVDSITGAAISGGQVTVALEQPDGTGTDVVFTQTKPDSSGHFSFNLLPLASMFDLVAVANKGSGVTYDATVILNISTGTSLGTIPLIAESDDSSRPATIEGIVTATSGSAPSSIRATISAIQTIKLRGGFTFPEAVPQTVTISGSDLRPVTIPGGAGTSADIFVRSASECPASAPKNVNCGHYVIVVPGNNPSVGRFEQGKISYSPPAPGPALYSVRANSYMPFGEGASVCIPSFQSADAAAGSQPLKVSPGGSVTASQIAFTGCW